ncbi:fused PTS fructose transporter subunit IIA/HPr protein [Conservatibacter flavescens]|uniref:Multiphosphoryl transfer protein n=1 Tax=Conservatibacter flavescens TaxID=28161 RepID=A0A2M8RZH9_9PAST|nr:fused PTS fructose transporter subunit IIA/HPr protein [Conservatibacter flavescens]PJG84303.1 bifunctional PTS fructose transporter subunit IIA/HPr protein [Conservatibacter flavescens]
MFNLPENNIHLAAQADNKQQAIEQVAMALEQAGYVEAGYLAGMLAREQQTSTFLGNGIAIPHGTLDTRHMVKNTGVQVFQFPQGIEWGEGNVAYVVIGIAARSDEHLALLRQLTHVLGDEDTAAKLATLTDATQFRAILMGENTGFSLQADHLSLDINTTSLLALTAINADILQAQSAVNSEFVSEVISSAALPLCDGLWLTDSVNGNLKNAIAFSRAATPFNHHGKTIHGVLTIAAVNDELNDTLARLLDKDVQQTLLTGGNAQIIAALNGVEFTENTASNAETPATNTVIGTFTIRNEHGLHARPSAVLVNVVKQFESKITIENLNRESAPVSAKSLMKVVALGVVNGHRLRFVAEGDDALQAIQAIEKAIQDGLGEGVSSLPPAIADSIEEQAHVTTKTANPPPAVDTNSLSQNNDAIIGEFVIQNEHGLHARPSAVLVNEVKKYTASVTVQNLDRDTQPVSAKSLMKIVALGATKGHRLRFVATGEQAQQAIDGIGNAIAAGLGE